MMVSWMAAVGVLVPQMEAPTYTKTLRVVLDRLIKNRDLMYSF